jgi:hypothetical protein
VVVTAGLAIGFAHVVQLKPNAGAHEYVVSGTTLENLKFIVCVGPPQVAVFNPPELLPTKLGRNDHPGVTQEQEVPSELNSTVAGTAPHPLPQANDTSQVLTPSAAGKLAALLVRKAVAIA